MFVQLRTNTGRSYSIFALIYLVYSIFRSFISVIFDLVHVRILVSEGDTTNVAFPCIVLLADEFPQSLESTSRSTECGWATCKLLHKSYETKGAFSIFTTRVLIN